MKLNKTAVVALFTLAVFSCRKEAGNFSNQIPVSDKNISSQVLTVFSENFETGTKAAYATGNVTLSNGLWNFNDALIGNAFNDVKNGLQSARIRNTGKLTMLFDYPNGAASVSIKYARFGNDANSNWELWYSINSGTSYTLAGSTVAANSSSLQTANFVVNAAGNIRLEVRKTSGGTNRINIDDIVITDYQASNALPVLNSISPASANAGSASFLLTASGNNFINSSVIKWNGNALTTSFISNSQLSATVSAAGIASAGTASVIVFTPAPGGGTSVIKTFTINTPPLGKKFLFDATKAETAGNADWVIDEDSSIPIQIPTLAQSGITANTSETYWTGAISYWGIDLAKTGNIVETLPPGGAITFGNTSNPQDLSHYDVFVVDEPNILFTSAEKTAIINFVNNGGGLFMVSDHTGSDRNNDGYDSPVIWNDLMKKNNVQYNPFGFYIDLTNISEVSSNVLANASSNVILNGLQGTVSQLQFNNGATIILNAAGNASVKGLIWQNGYAQTITHHVMCASSTYGTGRVFCVTDSSPLDDGTGAPGNNLYVGWTQYSHKNLFMNASLWLAKLQ